MKIATYHELHGVDRSPTIKALILYICTLSTCFRTRYGISAYLYLSGSTLLIVDVGHVALAAVHTVEVGSHEDARAALRAHLAKALHLSRVVHLVELKDAQLHLLVLVLLLLGLGVSLLLALLTTAEKAQGHVQLRIVRHAALGEAGSIRQLTTAEKNALVLSSDTLAGLDGSLHIGHGGIGAQLQDLSPVCIKYKGYFCKIVFCWLLN